MKANKALLVSIANFSAQTTAIVEQLAESHYINGAQNKQIKCLKAATKNLLDTIHVDEAFAEADPPPVVGSLPAQPPAPAAS